MNESEEAWRKELAAGVRTVDGLLRELQLSRDDFGREVGLRTDFPVAVPLAFVRRMRVRDPDDPLLLQVLPTVEEAATKPGFGTDPTGEGDRTTGSVIHKYHGRALLITTGACAVNCRYCFRQFFPYSEHAITPERLDDAVRYLADRPELEEVILSGGDPLVLIDSKLASIFRALSRVPTLTTLRIHTRLPIVLPSRVTESLTNLLRDLPFRTVVVVHANHPNEIDAQVEHALRRLSSSGITLLNQAVLLKRVNDDAGVLAALSKRLFHAATLPYYLHLLDRVSGSQRFAVSEVRAKEIAGQLLRLLPGYLVPRLVQERSEMAFKVPLSSVHGRSPGARPLTGL